VSAREAALAVRRRVVATVLVNAAATMLVVWRAPTLESTLALIGVIQLAAVLTVWRQLARALHAITADPATRQSSRDAERIAAAVLAVKNGDLTLRCQVTDGPLGPVGKAVDEMLEMLTALIVKLGTAAADVSGSAEHIERFGRVLAERSSRQGSAIAEVSRKLKGMGARSEEIGQIVELLEDVAAETNVLALNAALEASRAGAQGKGFGMVADEVRKLAERSAAATKDIGAFIQGIEATTDDTARSVEEIRGLTEGVANSATQTASAAGALLGSARVLSQTLLRLRVPGQDETDLARALRERRSEIARALEPIAPLLEGARTPLGDALKQVLIVLAEGAPRPPVPRSSSPTTGEATVADRPAPPALGAR
jgi:methyl-accepting chemotaxis protein